MPIRFFGVFFSPLMNPGAKSSATTTTPITAHHFHDRLRFGAPPSRRPAIDGRFRSRSTINGSAAPSGRRLLGAVELPQSFLLAVTFAPFGHGVDASLSVGSYSLR